MLNMRNQLDKCLLNILSSDIDKLCFLDIIPKNFPISIREESYNRNDLTSKISIGPYLMPALIVLTRF
ncbi:hypothetical protein FF38_02100 [Lucilia cuprina]|uniref:Uncharacterized protein n=1 Tax=Lucilia cuprina TaxID=7375 RepID=A0A0L0CUA7_LUCCU|nr:hypothetical protein FF38_02100 [Lucilia cuprina]